MACFSTVLYVRCVFGVIEKNGSKNGSCRVFLFGTIMGLSLRVTRSFLGEDRGVPRR